MPDNPITVVLVDDHTLVRETWKMLLQSVGYIDVIAEYSSGDEAIEAVPLLNPDVVLMDVNMQPVNGLEATRRILEGSPQTKIIGVSVNDQPGYARGMIGAGAHGYVTKNSSPVEMVEAIREVNRGGTFICAEIKEKMIDPR